jgi:redox-sensitive bicupin YhaK (pirin superfamily)
MKTVLYPASERGHFDFGWLNTYHTFSFGQYYEPSRMNFGALRVLNDDTVAPGEGFGTHPHKNMEIISIPLEGVIMHRDSMGHEEGIKPGEIQVMSAGTGITHSEFNGSSTNDLKFLQLWIIPEHANVTPRYEQAHIEPLTPNEIKTVIGPQGAGTPLWINQQAWLSLARISNNGVVTYTRQRSDSGVFLFVTDGGVEVAGSTESVSLSMRDGLGIMDENVLTFTSNADAHVIVIEVPLL